MERSRVWLNDASGSVADLGVLVPIVAALVLGNGLDAGTVLVCVGLLYILSGLYFRVPVPVQPIKAAAAIAIARDLSVATIGAAGIALGAILVLLAATGASRWLTRLFTMPIVRGLQLGVGLILLRAALDLTSARTSLTPLILAAMVAAALMVGTKWSGRVPVALLVVTGGVTYSLLSGAGLPHLEVSLWHPVLNDSSLDPRVLGSALVLLVIPQLPLTFGNAVVALTDLEHRYFATESRKVTPVSVSFSCGLANIATGAVGGMPMCHGSGGLTAHHRAGARTFRMNIVVGGVLTTLGLFFGPAALALLALVPIPVLAGSLAFTGLFHAGLAMSLRGADLAIALAMGLVGVATTNLALAIGIGLLLYWPLALMTGRREPEAARA